MCVPLQQIDFDMKKLTLILAALSLLMACNKEKAPEKESANISPDGKQWIVESNGSPDMKIGFLDLTLATEKPYIIPAESN